MSDVTDLVKAVPSVIALAFSIYVFWWTRKLARPFERPVLSLRDAQPRLDGGLVGYALTLKNTGQRRASEIEIRTRCAPEADLEAMIFIEAWAPANDYEPSAEMMLMRWPPASFESLTFMQVSVSYRDDLSRKMYSESYWMVVFPGPDGSVTGMNREQRRRVETIWGTRWSAARP